MKVYSDRDCCIRHSEKGWPKEPMNICGYCNGKAWFTGIEKPCLHCNPGGEWRSSKTAQARYLEALEKAVSESIAFQDQDALWRLIFPELTGDNFAKDFKPNPSDFSISYRINNGWFSRTIKPNTFYEVPDMEVGVKKVACLQDDCWLESKCCHTLNCDAKKVAVILPPKEEQKTFDPIVMDLTPEQFGIPEEVRRPDLRELNQKEPTFSEFLDNKLSKPELRNMKHKTANKCAEWLAYCISIGYSKDQIPALEKIWMDHHDENGNKIKNLNPIKALEQKEESQDELWMAICVNAFYIDKIGVSKVIKTLSEQFNITRKP